MLLQLRCGGDENLLSSEQQVAVVTGIPIMRIFLSLWPKHLAFFVHLYPRGS